MPRLIWFMTLALLLSPGLVSLARADNYSCQGWSHNPPDVPREGRINNDYAGIVTAVTKDSITIKWVNTPGVKPKKFAVSETLAAGQVPKDRRVMDNPDRNPALPPPRMDRPVDPEYMYRLTDVRVGDCVGIIYACINGVDICDHICIGRRPGGDVPPLPKEAEDLRDWRKAWMARTGQRLPDWMLKTPHVPYHEQRNAYWAKVAPMPREVMPPGPALDP